MRYIKSNNIKHKLREQGYQINKQALNCLDVKMDEYLDKCMATFNGHKKRITPELVMLIKL